MSRHKKDSLRTLTYNERQALTNLSRSRAAPSDQVPPATMLQGVTRVAN